MMDLKHEEWRSEMVKNVFGKPSVMRRVAYNRYNRANGYSLFMRSCLDLFYFCVGGLFRISIFVACSVRSNRWSILVSTRWTLQMHLDCGLPWRKISFICRWRWSYANSNCTIYNSNLNHLIYIFNPRFFAPFYLGDLWGYAFIHLHWNNERNEWSRLAIEENEKTDRERERAELKKKAFQYPGSGPLNSTDPYSRLAPYTVVSPCLFSGMCKM